MKFHFSKMHGLGNDFVVIDAINQQLTLSPTQIRFIADRHFGVGCDQVLLVEKPQSANADFRYRIFNADGGEVAQCGNGARCFARFVRERRLTDKADICVDTDAGQLLLHCLDDRQVMVNMGVPRHQPRQIPLQAEQELPRYSLRLNGGEEIEFGAVSLGNPHAVLLIHDLQNAPVGRLGSLLESHPVFPERANIGFMEILDRQHIRLRVYERGSGETLACGSGACAAVVVGVTQGLLDSQVSVRLPGGELQIRWDGPGQPVMMTGPAVTVFDGTIELP